MNKDDIIRISKLLQRALDNPRSKKEITKTFTDAGIIDKKGNLRYPYKNIYIPVN